MASKLPTFAKAVLAFCGERQRDSAPNNLDHFDFLLSTYLIELFCCGSAWWSVCQTGPTWPSWEWQELLVGRLHCCSSLQLYRWHCCCCWSSSSSHFDCNSLLSSWLQKTTSPPLWPFCYSVCFPWLLLFAKSNYVIHKRERKRTRTLHFQSSDSLSIFFPPLFV